MVGTGTTGVIVVSALAAVMLTAAVLLVRRSLGRLEQVTHSMSTLAASGVQGDPLDVKEQDEIGELVKAFNVFRANALSMQRMASSMSEQTRLLETVFDNISDGLSADLSHICEESGCGALLHAPSIPLTPAAAQMNDGRTPLEHALGDGEDFELLFAVSPDDGRKLLNSQPIAGLTLVHIGERIADRKLVLEDDGRCQDIKPSGYVHEF